MSDGHTPTHNAPPAPPTQTATRAMEGLLRTDSTVDDFYAREMWEDAIKLLLQEESASLVDLRKRIDATKDRAAVLRKLEPFLLNLLRDVLVCAEIHNVAETTSWIETLLQLMWSNNFDAKAFQDLAEWGISSLGRYPAEYRVCPPHPCTMNPLHSHPTSSHTERPLPPGECSGGPPLIVVLESVCPLVCDMRQRLI